MMRKYKGFRADRLREAMEEAGIVFEDIVDTYNRRSNEKMDYDAKHFLLDVIDGFKKPKLDTIFMLCEIVGCTSDYLLGLSSKMY